MDVIWETPAIRCTMRYAVRLTIFSADGCLCGRYNHSFTNPRTLSRRSVLLSLIVMALSTWAMYVHQGVGPAFLPAISSDTWTRPPGSYLSRWVVGLTTDTFAVSLVAI